MKGMKGKFLKKLKSIRPLGNLKQDRILYVRAADGLVDACPKNTGFRAQTLLVFRGTEQEKMKQSTETVQEPEIIDVAELMRDLEDDDTDCDDLTDDKENIGPATKARNPIGYKESFKKSGRAEPHGTTGDEGSPCVRPGNRKQNPLSEIDISSFRRPDLNSGDLFDPNLLEAFRRAVEEHAKISEAERKRVRTEEEEKPGKSEEEESPSSTCSGDEEKEEEENPLLAYEERCPPGGGETVVLYTTTLRGIRKTFEDCNSVRFLLDSFRVVYSERDVSMHMEFRDELWRVVGGKPVPPRLFIKGRYIGGAEIVLGLHEQGKLRPLFQGLPLDRSTAPCESCAGIRFVLCFNCNGSHKLVSNHGLHNKCPHCNENGLIICPVCC